MRRSLKFFKGCMKKLVGATLHMTSLQKRSFKLGMYGLLSIWMSIIGVRVVTGAR